MGKHVISILFLSIILLTYPVEARHIYNAQKTNYESEKLTRQNVQINIQREESNQQSTVRNKHLTQNQDEEVAAENYQNIILLGKSGSSYPRALVISIISTIVVSCMCFFTQFVLEFSKRCKQNYSELQYIKKIQIIQEQQMLEQLEQQKIFEQNIFSNSQIDIQNEQNQQNQV
ncbi:transmembrane protein, putative (macronuclear) [Tetrahymena thermophila SB210]|uniref:Transmembrane protein, putative n=1 Tax=Tetrahymena thermophila (strain SB210) TaxID=312017 RepID=W7X987_TETTS|nr:transmembrane protein, putative [Tetrahymena thermophila SB210]EWS75955.1 transmembrane protein, putative [Tetrahymena thermophila SB210]|eukprot:XP_012651473.1 transmembrane protein, putative [Tetrahymena thermophila SB210]